MVIYAAILVNDRTGRAPVCAVIAQVIAQVTNTAAAAEGER
jgi:hypothetical protein